MSKRGLSQKDFEMLFKYPHVGCIFLGVSGIIMSFVFQGYLQDLSTLMLVGGIALTVLGIFIAIAISSDKSTESEDKRKDSMYDNSKEKPATYELWTVKFNLNTRICKLEFIEIKSYRTVERYITRNYVKYPVLSPWKSKRQTITKNIRLSNEELEKLNFSSDFLIRKFAFEIISQLGHEDLTPSWYKKQLYKQEYKRKIESNEQKRKAILHTLSKVKKAIEYHIESITAELRCAKELLKKQNKRKCKASKKIDRAQARKKSVVLSIITVGIYAYITSSRYMNRLLDRVTQANADVDNTTHNIEALKLAIFNEEKNLSAKITQAEKECKLLDEANERAETELNEKLALIVPLKTSVDATSDFVPLKDFIGIKYKKTVGIYIIRNNENGKYYVGQSKDVYRRIKQHFKGAEPSNIIFAQDYFYSLYSDKSLLFSIKIIECLHAELDETEKYYIGEYNAYEKGYNSTHGNGE